MPNHPARTTLALVLLSTLMLNACSSRETPPAPAQEDPKPAQSEPASAGTIAIGELSGIALRDGELEFPNDNKILGIGKTPEEVAEVLTASGLPTDKLGLAISPLLVKAADRTLLFDTGAGGNFGPTAGNLARSLAESGVQADQVTDIFISHAHGDHIGGLLTADGALAFPNATVHISAPEWAHLTSMSAETAGNSGVGKHAQLVAAVTPKVDAFEPDAELIPGVVKAKAIRGHTPGHSGYLIGTGDSSLLYIGDSMHHHVISVQRPEWTIQFDGDAPTAQQSRIDLIAASAANRQRIYAVHFPYPAVGRFEQRGERYHWVAE